MNRTLKDATVKRYFYETHDQLRAHLRDFVDAYNFARRLKTLRGLTPYEFICKALDFTAAKIYNQSAPENAGTKHLGRWIIRRTLLRLRAPLLDHLNRDHRALVEQQASVGPGRSC